MLVVQAEGNPAKLDAFGPVMNETHVRPHRNRRQALGERRQGLLISHTPTSKTSSSVLLHGCPGKDGKRLRPLPCTVIAHKKTRQRGWDWRGGLPNG